MGKKKNHYRITGRTVDGKIVVSGAFQMFDTMGTPLPIMFMMMGSNNMIPDPVDFYTSAVNAGWKKQTIIDRLKEAYLDGFGKDFWIEIEKRLNFYIQQHGV